MVGMLLFVCRSFPVVFFIRSGIFLILVFIMIDWPSEQNHAQSMDFQIRLSQRPQGDSKEDEVRAHCIYTLYISFSSL